MAIWHIKLERKIKFDNTEFFFTQDSRPTSRDLNLFLQGINYIREVQPDIKFKVKQIV